MAAWDSDRLYRSLKSSEIKPFYCLYGDETFLLEDALRALINTALDGGLADFNLDVFYGADAEVTRIRDVYETLPMMATRRVVVVKEAQQLSAKELEQLLPVLDQPLDGAVLILVASKVDMRLKFFKKFSEAGVSVKFDRPYDNQIPGWIENLAGRLGLKMTPQATDLLHQMVGGSLVDIHNELSKLSAYLGSDKVVEASHVQEVVARIRIDSIFALAEAIGTNHREAALVCLANLLGHGENPVGIVALISRHVRILTMAKEGAREGLSSSQLASRIGVNPYFMKDYLQQARSWPDDKLRSTHSVLLETDRALKSSPVSSHIWLENLVLKTCSA